MIDSFDRNLADQINTIGDGHITRCRCHGAYTWNPDACPVKAGTS